MILSCAHSGTTCTISFKGLKAELLKGLKWCHCLFDLWPLLVIIQKSKACHNEMIMSSLQGVIKNTCGTTVNLIHGHCLPVQ